ncbi:MAG: YkgJ family cysteine cluster protein [Myxococcaceae bacterium]|nr:YkgJ family cysteine cluster protein [Myxococcaceae bacterium]
MSEDFDVECVACGACCSGKRDYVQVFWHDAEKLGAARVAELVAEPVGEHPASVGRPAEAERYMRMTKGRCAALTNPTPDQFVCAVYEDRPVLCHALERGGSACRDARARAALFQVRPGNAPGT